MAKAVWGIDVSKFSIKAVRAEGGKGGVTLTGLEVIEYPVPTGNEEIDVNERIREGLRTFMAKAHAQKDLLCCSIPGHATFNRFIKLPQVEPKRIAEIVRYEAQQHIPFPIDEVIWDFQKIERNYEVGEEMEVVLFAIKKDIVSSFLGDLAAVDIEIDQLQFAPVALYNFMMYDQDVSRASVVLDMGADNTDLIIIDGDKFWIRNLPIAGNDITKTIAKKFNCAFNEAEKLKVTAAQSPQAAKIFNVIQPVLKDLVGEIHRSIGYYKSLSKTARLERLVIAGNSSKTLNFQKFLSQQLQMEAVKITKLGKLAVGSRVSEPQLQKYLPSLGVAIGLALQGLGESSNHVNLLPPELVAKKKVAAKRPFVIAAAACLLATAGASFFGGTQEKDQLGELKLTAEQVVADFQTLQSNVQTAKREVADVMPTLEEIAKIAPERDLSIKVYNAVCAELEKHAKVGDVKEGESNLKDRVWLLEYRTEHTELRKKEPIPPELQQADPITLQVKTENEVIVPVLRATLTCAVMKSDTIPTGTDAITKVTEWIKVPVAAKLGIPTDVEDYAKVNMPDSEAVPFLLTRDGEAERTRGSIGMPGSKPEGKYFRLTVEWTVPIGEAARKLLATTQTQPEGN